MILHLVGGWTENIGDGAPFWDLAKLVPPGVPAAVDAAHDALQNALQANTGTFAPGDGVQVIRHTCGEDLGQWFTPGHHKRLWVAYSYGVARIMRDLLAYLANPAKRLTTAPVIDDLRMIAGVPRWMDGQSGPWYVPGPAYVSRAKCYNCNSFPVSQPIGEPLPNQENVDCAAFPDGSQTSHISIQYHPQMVAGIKEAIETLYNSEASQ